MKKVKGYMSSRSFMGERVPQHIQNQIIRNYCTQNNFYYMLSAVEYAMKNSFLILNQIIKANKEISGIGFYSIFQLPENDILRMLLLKKIIAKRIIILFCSEGFIVKNYEDIIRVNTIWLIKKKLKYSLTNFDYFKKNKTKN